MRSPAWGLKQQLAYNRSYSKAKKSTGMAGMEVHGAGPCEELSEPAGLPDPLNSRGFCRLLA